MNGEIAIFGVYMPTILLIAVAASALTLALMRVADFVGFYRIVGYRALVDLCLYVMVFGLLSFLAIHSGFHP
ncbi:DUF1656 domain-containing protein [Novosphingobium panipatense]|uniref:DUF1656 domain-containing protein n=1 Tax=Novosphingobium panipatense TaxID=428991 RepID=A0ABY1QTW2_9SPHN|nr:DUF1656 domain-containing protein [Novosphingobium panipatense]SMP77869.1 Protein of unknown function [Novosphingobium panipatense]